MSSSAALSFHVVRSAMSSAHPVGHGIGLNEVVDRGAAITGISARERASRPERSLACRCPHAMPGSRSNCTCRTVFGNVGQSYEDCPVTRIRPTDHILYAVQQYGACRLEQHLFSVCIELANREAAAGG